MAGKFLDVVYQIAFGILWTPLFILNVVYDLMWLEWNERRKKAKTETNFPQNRRDTISVRDTGN